MQIVQTRDYNSFKRLPGNRQLHKAHLARLKESIAKEPELSRYQPILVNASMEVIDGQHRLEALQELEEPIYYIKGDHLKLGDVQTLNTLAKVWSPIDYAKSYVELGNTNYQHYLDIRDKYHLPHQLTLTYLAGHEIADQSATFRNGSLVVRDLPQALVYLDQLEEIGQYYPRYTHKAFANALLRIMQHQSYDHERMVSRMRLRGHTIGNFSLTEDYQRAIEAVYNWHIRADRVRFF